MNIIYARESFPPNIFKQDVDSGETLSSINSIFLAGPTPRDSTTLSWRESFVKDLSRFNYEGSIFIPEDRPEEEDKIALPTDLNSWDEQVEWEWAGLERADCILFWIPRNMKNLPGLTTNIEIGLACGLYSNKTIVGFPEHAEHCRYIQRICRRFKIPCYDSVNKMIRRMKVMLNERLV